jgi:hypothetical protein
VLRRGRPAVALRARRQPGLLLRPLGQLGHRRVWLVRGRAVLVLLRRRARREGRLLVARRVVSAHGPGGERGRARPGIAASDAADECARREGRLLVGRMRRRLGSWRKGGLLCWRQRSAVVAADRPRGQPGARVAALR